MPTSASAMDLPITCSWAQSASVSLVYITAISASWASSSISASCASTASYAINAAGSGVVTASAYTTLTTSSLNWITCSFFDTKEYVVLNAASVTYNFTCSNLPSEGMYSNVALFISNSFLGNTASLSFPSTWTFIGIVPTYITASKNAYLNLEAFGNRVVASWGPQY